MAIPEIFTDSFVMGRAAFEGATGIRMWTVRLDEIEACEHGSSFGKRTVIGNARLLTLSKLNQESLYEADIIPGDLADVVSLLLENAYDSLPAPILILDGLHVEHKYRGRGLAEEVAKAAFGWFEGLVKSHVLVVTARPKFRPAALRVAEKLGFGQLKDDVWIRTL